MNLASGGCAVDMSMVCLLENEHTKDQALVHMSVCSN